MRHRDIKTTLCYYISQDVEDIAADLWAIHAESNISGNTTQKTPDILAIS
jgi:hypothetical protein